jgi:hypothetical protein
LFPIEDGVFQHNRFGSIKESVGNRCQWKLGQVEFIHGRIKWLVLWFFLEGV